MQYAAVMGLEVYLDKWLIKQAHMIGFIIAGGVEEMKGMGVLIAIGIMTLFLIALSLVSLAEPVHVTPNQLTALEARVTTLEGQVKELRRVVGIEGGLKEGLQNKQPAPVPPKK